MSTLRVQNIGAPGAGPSTDVMAGLDKVQCSINMTTASILDNLNVASITDNGVGVFTANFTAVLAYVNAPASYSSNNYHSYTGTVVTNLTSIGTRDSANAAIDVSYASIRVSGDLA